MAAKNPIRQRSGNEKRRKRAPRGRYDILTRDRRVPAFAWHALKGQQHWQRAAVTRAAEPGACMEPRRRRTAPALLITTAQSTSPFSSRSSSASAIPVAVPSSASTSAVFPWDRASSSSSSSPISAIDASSLRSRVSVRERRRETTASGTARGDKEGHATGGPPLQSYG